MKFIKYGETIINIDNITHCYIFKKQLIISTNGQPLYVNCSSPEHARKELDNLYEILRTNSSTCNTKCNSRNKD